MTRNICTHTAAILLSVAAICTSAQAERLKLRYAATVITLDDTGRKTGTRQLKAGTEIIVADSSSPQPVQQTDSSAGKTSEMSPAQFIAERRTTPTTFVAEARLDANPVCLEKRLNPNFHWAARLTIYGASRRSSETATAFAKRNTIPGDRLYRLLRDGEEHRVLATIQCLPGTEWPNQVVLTAIKELPPSDPLALKIFGN